jgi:hypothetical protein
MKKRVPTFPGVPNNAHLLTTLDDQPFYRQMDIVAGVQSPLNWDVREAILVEAANRDFAQLRYYNHQSMVAALPYLRELFGIPRIKNEVNLFSAIFGQRNPEHKVIFDYLRQARAVKLGLPANTSWQVLLEAERANDRSILTMSDLRRARDERNGTTCPARPNDGKW